MHYDQEPQNLGLDVTNATTEITPVSTPSNDLEINTPAEIMRTAGIKDEQIVRLVVLRRKIASGGCDDLTIEYKRSMFLKYLYEGGILHDYRSNRYFSGPNWQVISKKSL